MQRLISLVLLRCSIFECSRDQVVLQEICTSCLPFGQLFMSLFFNLLSLPLTTDDIVDVQGCVYDVIDRRNRHCWSLYRTRLFRGRTASCILKIQLEPGIRFQIDLHCMHASNTAFTVLTVLSSSIVSVRTSSTYSL